LDSGRQSNNPIGKVCTQRANKALQTDERRATVTADRNVALASLAAERQSRSADMF